MKRFAILSRKLFWGAINPLRGVIPSTNLGILIQLLQQDPRDILYLQQDIFNMLHSFITRLFRALHATFLAILALYFRKSPFLTVLKFSRIFCLNWCTLKIISFERSWVFATNSGILIHISLQHNVVLTKGILNYEFC